MYLIPEVKEMRVCGGSCELLNVICISVENESCELISTATFLQKRIGELTGTIIPVVVSDTMGSGQIRLISGNNDLSEKYLLTIEKNGIEIFGDSVKALSWGIQTLLQIIQQSGLSIPCLEIKDNPDFKHRGFYHDVTRGKVPKLSTLKMLVEKCAYYKINELQLYVEHSFAFSCLPELWNGKTPLTSEEILELDRYCKRFHIDLIPSMATFGHLYELLRLKKYEHLNELEISASELPHDLWERMAHYTIDPSNEESFALVKQMMSEYLPLFSSKYFNICCDETFDLGKGRNKERAEQCGVGRVYVDFVKKIAEFAISCGKIPMMWGDIVLNHRELIRELPKKTVFLNWEYGAEITDEATKGFSETGVEQIVCPGVQGWSRFAYNIEDASKNIRKKVQYGTIYNASGVLNTDWGDCGHVNFISGTFHGLAFGAALSWNASSFTENSEFDKAVSVLEWGDSNSRTASLLRELGSLCWYHFGNIYAWVNNKDCLWNREKDILKIDFDTLRKNFVRAGEIHDEFMKIKDSNSPDFAEFVLSSELIRWTLALLVFKKVKEYGQESDILLSGNELIDNGNTLLNEFVYLWRLRNKESELFEIVAVFKLIFDKLSKID